MRGAVITELPLLGSNQDSPDPESVVSESRRIMKLAK
jgi:hypothetical protein